MNIDMVQEFVRYNAWANQRVFDVVIPLDAGQFTQILGGSYPSLQSTLTHIVWVEWLWLERWKGSSPMNVWAPEDYPTATDLANRWRPVQAEQQSLVQAATVDELQRVIRYTNRQGKACEYALWRMIVHVINHSSYHRG